MRLMLIDSSNILWIHTLARKKDNILKAFLEHIIHLIEDYGAQQVILLNDVQKSRYRESIYPEYKGKRLEVKKKPAQIKREKEMRAIRSKLGNLFGDAVIDGSVVGVEADDIASLICKDFKEKHDIILVSQDKDLLQLGVRQIDPKSNKEITDFHGLTPRQITQYLLLTGDVVDNIKGVTGFGEVSSEKLLKKYGSIKKFIDVKDEKDKKLQKLIDYLNTKQGKSEAKLAYKLVKLFDDYSNMNDFEIKQYEAIKKNIEEDSFKPYRMTDDMEDLYSEFGFSQAYWLMEKLNMIIELNRSIR